MVGFYLLSFLGQEDSNFVLQHYWTSCYLFSTEFNQVMLLYAHVKLRCFRESHSFMECWGGNFISDLYGRSGRKSPWLLLLSPHCSAKPCDICVPCCTSFREAKATHLMNADYASIVSVTFLVYFYEATDVKTWIWSNMCCYSCCFPV